MRKIFRVVVLGLSFALPYAASAQDIIPDRRVILSTNTDIPGFDLGSIFDTTLDACERACVLNEQCQAFTYNDRNASCFVKSAVGQPTAFERAISGVLAPPVTTQSAARDRRASLDFLSDSDIGSATAQAQGLARQHAVDGWGAEDYRAAARQSTDGAEAISDLWGAAVVAGDQPSDWVAYSDALMASSRDDGERRGRAFRAAINALLRTDAPDLRHDALVALSRAAIAIDRGSDAVRALRLAQDIAPNDATQALLADAAGKYGFRVAETEVQSDAASPRLCVTFTEKLPTGTDFTPFVRLADTALTVEPVGDRQLCVGGVAHGTRYTLTLRSGLPAADGQTLANDTQLGLYVRDRTASARFPGRGYVLPQVGDAAIPVETVNTETLDLSLFHITDRNLLRTMQSSYFAAPVDGYEDYMMDGEIGTKVWTGSATVPMDINQDMTTRLPLEDAVRDLPAGLYALRATIPGKDPYDVPPAWQWFVISDLGISTFLGAEGLDVAVRSLASTDAKAGVGVELISRSNEVLGTVATDADGRATFDAGLTRGTGGAAPALVVVRDGDDDLAFLSLTEPEFDLSDRGVQGREVAPPVDVFLTTDRGAYRAGETVNVTALARDAQARAIEGLPLTAVVRRPDGIEYNRMLVADAGAGGHVFAQPIAGNAPRGVWRVDMYADTGGAPLASQTFLVEDFLPERIDFTMALPADLQLNTAPDLTIDARYLFGAPGADLVVEGEVLLRAASSLPGYEGFSFGRHDEPFVAMMEPLPAAQTDAAGQAVVAMTLPFVETPTRPLEARITARVVEGSGRPVERQEVRIVRPGVPLIGIRPMFDGVAGEGAEAAFSVISLDADGQPTPVSARWVLSRIETRYQWYQQYGNWNWDPVTTRTQVAEGEVRIDGRAEIASPVNWGEYELSVESAGASTSITFYAGWYAPADTSTTPDTLELSLDKPAYAVGDTAMLRVVPRFEGTALLTVLSNQVVSMQAVAVTEGENLIPLPVGEDWGTGVYVTASVLRPMDVAAGRNPARALGLAHAAIDPGARKLAVSVETAPEADPRGPLDVAIKVDGVAAGEVAYATLAAVDEGILNLTGFESPDPNDHFFGQRRLGVGIRDIYGRLIDGLNGAEGQVRSGGDAGAQAGLQAPPPTEQLVSFFSGPLVVEEDGYARASFDLPAFNGSVKIMAVAWSDTAVGQADTTALVRDPVVVTASLPRFLSPGDQSRLLLEIVHATGPAGNISLELQGHGVSLGATPVPFDLAEKAKAVFEVPVTAGDVGNQTIDVALVTPDGKRLSRTLTIPVQVNDPAVARTRRMDLAAGDTFAFDGSAYDGLIAGTARATLAIGPIARMNAPGLLAELNRYPYGCAEQITSKALPLVYYDQVAQAMQLEGADDIPARLEQAVASVLTNQGSEGGFGLWGPGSGDFWLDAYVTDFLSRARSQGVTVPDLALRRALDNLRNQVTYAPDFAADTNDGGTGLAYGLMVLAREGAAAIGDLRYYADVKADDFATPMAQAQLGAALASYGDQTRADAMFAKANARIMATSPESKQTYRSDYGTYRRDAAAVLALAVEAGSTAVDREALISRISTAAGRLSTQEAVWTLLATNALIDAPALPGLTIDGRAPEGPLVRMVRDGDKPVLVENGSDQSTTLTVTAYGVPIVPEPAGGNGYVITRRYFTPEGQEVPLSDVKAGTRLVAVLDVSPYGSGEARLMVADPLPAGFEIDNPNLISGGETSGLEWLETEVNVTHTEFRQDRFLTAIDRHNSDPFRLAYMVRAVSPGVFHHPAASVEDMYRPDFRAHTDAGTVTVTP